MFVYCFQRVYDIVPPLSLVLQPPVTRVTSGWLVGPFPTVDVWRYVSTTCGGLSVTMCGELMMHWLFVGSWDSLAEVKTYIVTKQAIG